MIVAYQTLPPSFHVTVLQTDEELRGKVRLRVVGTDTGAEYDCLPMGPGIVQVFGPPLKGGSLLEVVT